MTEQEYRSAPGINQSTLKAMRISPAHYKWATENQGAKDTPDLRIGRAVHAAILTPTAFKREYLIAPDKRTTEGKAIAAAAPANATFMKPDEMELVKQMVRSFKQCPEAVQLLKGTRREVPAFWTDPATGLPCKCRFDAISSTAVIDIKTFRDNATQRAFLRECGNRGYHIQAAHYLAGAEAIKGHPFKWYFIVIEKAPPYGVHVFQAAPGFVDAGEIERITLLSLVRKCEDSGQWPCYKVEELDAPDYWFS